jgi:ABC-type glycerol-3-phosphate transport system substrate-binding protein
MQPKSRIVAALFLNTVAFCIGCSSRPTVVAAPDPVTIRVACPAGPAADVVRAYCKAWQARNNAIVAVNEYGAEGPESTEADAWAIAPADLGRWAARGKLRPIPEELLARDDSFGWKGLLPLYREHLLLWDRVPYALPLVGSAPICCYRSDLFKDAGMKPPATWHDIEKAAALFTKKLQAPCLPPLPVDDDGLELEFTTIAAGYAQRAITEGRPADLDPFSLYYDLKTGKPRIDGPGFVHALALMQRLQAYRAKEDAASIDAFRRGIGVLVLTDAAQIYRLQDPKSAVRDRFSVTRMPAAELYFAPSARLGDEPTRAGVGGNWMPYLGAGGWLGVVPTSSTHAVEAFSLLAELSGRDVSRQVVLTPRSEPAWGGGALRFDHFDRRSARWEAFDLDAARTEEFKNVVQTTLEHAGVANPVYPLRMPDQRQRRTVLVQALRSALKDSTIDPAKALAAVARAWEAMDRANPQYLEEYRLGIGLRSR